MTNDGRIAATQNALAEAPWPSSTVAPFEAIDSISCTPQRDLCAASTSDGKVATTVRTSEGLTMAWSTADIDGARVIRSISCPTAGFCAAADLEGNILSSTQPTAGASAWQVTATDGSREITSISCPSQAFCVAVDNAGNVLWSTDPSSALGTWRHAHVSQALSGVSCSSPAFCVAVNLDGEVLTAHQDSAREYVWQSSGMIAPGRELTGISCVDEALCVAVDSLGGALESTKPEAGAKSWVTTQLQPFGTDSYLFGVSCGSPTFCVAAGEHRVLLGESRATLSPPIPGRRQTVTVVSGTVTVRVPGTRRFERLSQSSTIPDGSEVDTTNGRVGVETATATAPAHAEVYGGRFRIHQDPAGANETHFRLSLPLTGCAHVALPRGAAAIATRHRPRSRHLWVSEHGGSWGTNGRYVSTTVEGSGWLTQDECGQSQVFVVTGKVAVRDLARNKTKVLTAGQRYTVHGRRR